MKWKFRSAAIGVVAIAALSTAAYTAGLFPGFPIVGGSAYCTSVSGVGNTAGTGQPSITGTPGQFGQGFPNQGAASAGGNFNAACNTTAPQGPPVLTGEELVPADTQLANGQQPQTVLIPTSLLGNATNRIIGGDMTTNLAQRLNSTKGIAALATLSPTAAVMTADRWWVIAPAAGVTVTIDSTAATAVIPGLNNTKALRIARTSSGAAGIVCTGQTLDAAASAPLIGSNAVFSFFQFNGPTQSASGGNIAVHIDYSSVADTAGTQATLGFAGGNGSKYALGDAGQVGTPTNYTAAIAGFSPGTTGTVASGVATIPASTTWTRYAVYAPIPTNIPGTTTPVTSVSVSVCWTPTATTAVATDYIELNFMQLESKPSTVTASLPAGVISPTGVERRLAAFEQDLQLQYLYFVYESQTLVAPVPGTGCTTVTSTTTGLCNVSFPRAMRITPAVSYTDGFQMFTSTAYTTLGALSALATYSNTVVTVPSAVGVMFKATASTIPAVGTANFLMQLGTSSATGIISASAEP